MIGLDGEDEQMRGQTGFSLIEMAMVTVIIGLLLGGMMMPLQQQLDHLRYKETRTLLDKVQEALVGYTVIHGYLPCPDCADGVGECAAVAAAERNDGREERDGGGTCTVFEGNLPWDDLGVEPVDAWGHRLRYRVDSVFAQSSSPFGINTGFADDLKVMDEGGSNPLVSGTPGLVISHGKNGGGAIMISGARMAVGTHADELENSNGDKVYVRGGDDLMVWLSRPVLVNRLVMAGRLP